MNVLNATIISQASTLASCQISPCPLNLAPGVGDHAGHDAADVVRQLVEVGHRGGVQQLVWNLIGTTLRRLIDITEATIGMRGFRTFLRVATAAVSTPFTATEVVAPWLIALKAYST